MEAVWDEFSFEKSWGLVGFLLALDLMDDWCFWWAHQMLSFIVVVLVAKWPFWDV